MKNTFNLWARMTAIATILLLASCGGGGGGGGGGTAGGAVGGKVNVVDGYITGAIVFLDKNKNGKYDTGEPVAINTNPAIGEYTFKGISQATLNLYPVVVEVPAGATDSDRPGQPITQPFNMTSPAGGNVISPMTTLIDSQLKNNPGMTSAQAQASIKKLIGLPANSLVDLTANYIGQTGANQAAYQKVHKVAQSVAASVAANQTTLQNAAPKGTSQATLVDLMVQDALAKLPTIVMKVDAASTLGVKNNIGGLIGGSLPQIDVAKLRQNLAKQKNKKNTPVLVLNGNKVVTLVAKAGAIYSDKGAIAYSSDPAGVGVVTPTVTGSGAVVDATVAGRYTITYTVSGVNGVKAVPLTRYVNITAAPDTFKPTLKLIGGVVSFAAGSAPYTEPGFIALDTVKAGANAPVTDISNSVTMVVKNGLGAVVPAVNSAVKDNYTVTYSVIDAAGNPATPVTRGVNVTAKPADITPPILVLNAPNGTNKVNMRVTVGSVFSDPKATATDLVDGDISAKIGMKSTVNTAKAGVYKIVYSVSDAAGNAAAPLTRIVTVANKPDTTKPLISLIGGAATVVQGNVYVDQAATATDVTASGSTVSLTAKINVKNPVDTSKPGLYTVTYTVSDAAGNSAAQVTRDVTVTKVVADAVPPVLSLNGSAVMTIVQNSIYKDQAATAFDLVDGAVTPVVTGAVDTAVLGANTITYTATDAAGNVSTATRKVNVILDPALIDNVPPVVVAPKPIRIEATGLTTAVTLGTATVTDAVTTGLTVTASPAGPYAVGVHNITWTSTADAAGNVGTATQVVTVTDTTLPVVTAPAAVTLEATGLTTAVTLGTATVTDAVTAGLTVTASPAGPYAVGVHNITWTSTADAAGNVGTATQVVTITDTRLPVVTAPAAVTLEATGLTTPVTLGTATVTDAVTAGLTATASPVGPYAVGATTVTWTSTADAAGNVGTATQVVTVTDTTLPVVTAPAAVTLEATGATTAVPLGAATVADAVTTGLTATASPAGPYPVGIHNITWTSTADAAGNVGTATQTVTVTDTTLPVVTAPVAVTLEATGATTAVPLGAATVADAVTAGLTATASPAGPYAVGIHNITWTSTADAAGNVGTATQVVTVTDATLPVVTAPAAVTLEATGLTTAVILGTATVTDAVTTGLTATASPVGPYAVGATTVTWTSTADAAGNVGTATQVVTVTDTTLPVITAPAAITVEATGPQTTVQLGNATVTDNAGATLVATSSTLFVPGTPVTLSPTSFPLGTTTVTWSATDASGNAALLKTQSVTVVDTTPAVITLNNPNMTVLINTAFIDPGAVAADSVDGNVNLTGLGIVTVGTLGTYQVVYNYTDGAGNFATTVTRNVTVVNTPDTTPPVMTLLGAPTVNLKVGDVYNDAGATAMDNRDGAITPVMTGAVDTAVAATYTLTYTATDVATNASTVTRTVIVAPLVGGALADYQINTGNLTGANTTYANILTNNATDIEAAIGQSMTAMMQVIDNASFRALATKFTFDTGASLPTAAATATEFNGAINGAPAPANPILVNWARNSAALITTGVNANALQDPGLDPVLLELSNAIARLEAVKAAGFTTQVVQGKTWDVADIDGTLGILYAQRGLMRWARAYNWDTQTNAQGVSDMFTVNYTDPTTSIVYPYQPIAADPVAVLNNAGFFSLQANGVTLLAGANADFLASAAMDKAFYTAMLNNVTRRSDGTHPLIAEQVKTSSNNNQQWGPQLNQFGNPIVDQWGNPVWGPIYTPPAPTVILSSAELNQRILNAQRTMAALDTAGAGLNVNVAWPDAGVTGAAPTAGVVAAHKAFVGTPLSRGLLKTFEYRNNATGLVVTPNAALSKKYNTPVVSETPAPTTALGWQNVAWPAGSQLMRLPNGVQMFVVTAYAEVPGSTNANPLLPVNDATLGGVLSTAIDLNAVNNHPAPTNVFPAPQTVVTYTDFPTPVVVTNSLQVAKVTAAATGVVTVPVSIAGNTNTIGAVTFTVSYDITAITALTVADVTLGADASAAGWTVAVNTAPGTPVPGVGSYLVSLYKPMNVLNQNTVSNPNIALANINFAVNSIANPLPITVQSLQVFSSTNADISAQYTSVNGSIN